MLHYLQAYLYKLLKFNYEVYRSYWIYIYLNYWNLVRFILTLISSSIWSQFMHSSSLKLSINNVHTCFLHSTIWKGFASYLQPFQWRQTIEQQWATQDQFLIESLIGNVWRAWFNEKRTCPSVHSPILSNAFLNIS